MIKTNLFETTPSHSITFSKGRFSVLEYERDFSVTPENAAIAFYSSKMNVRKRQLIADLTDTDGVIVQAGMMQMMLGPVLAATNVKSVGDLAKKFVGSKVTGETTIKPRYIGNGQLLLEPTFNHILIEDLADWNEGMVIEDGMFLACDDSVGMKVTARNTVSSAVLGGEGLFNTTLFGDGCIALESPVPAEEIIVVDLVDDELRIDGNMAVAWSYSLKFTVERTTKTLVGSAASGEGLVNVYRGTGRVLVAPVERNRGISSPKNTKGFRE